MKLDENSGTANVYSVAAATSTTGTMQGSMTEDDWVMGKYGSALDFDGVNDYIEIEDNPGLDLTQNFTLMAWIFPRSWGENSQGRIIDHGGGSAGNAGWAFHIDNITSARRPKVQINGLEYNGNTGSLELNKWQHVAAVFNENTLEFYVNGEIILDTIGTSVQTPVARADPIIIGARIDDYARQFDGLIDTENELEATETLDVLANEGGSVDCIVTVVGFLKIAD